jgi:hypothetical protein
LLTLYATTTLNAVVYPRLALVYNATNDPVSEIDPVVSELKSIEDVDIPRNSSMRPLVPDEPAVPLVPLLPAVPLVPLVPLKA